MNNRPIPVRPAPSHRSASGIIDDLARATIYQARGQDSAIARAKLDDPTNHRLHKVIERGAVTPLMSSTSATFNETSSVDDVANIVGPATAFKAITAKSVNVNLETRSASVSVPSAVASATGISFIAQGAPIPVRQAEFSGVTLNSRTAACIVVLTKEVTNSSNALPLSKQLIKENIGVAMDSILLDAIETDTVRPSGLRFGISAETTGGASSMVSDVTKLIASVSPVAGAMSNVLLIASPDIAAKLIVSLPLLSNSIQIVGSAGLSAGTLVALAANGVAIGAGSEIRYETSDVAALHMEDAAPAALSTIGTPNVTSAPNRTMWQTDCTALKVIFECDWKIRFSNSLSWMTAIEWGEPLEE